MIRRLLVDYGEVLSAPLAEDAIADLAALVDQPRAAFLDRYWELRPRLRSRPVGDRVLVRGP